MALHPNDERLGLYFDIRMMIRCKLCGWSAPAMSISDAVGTSREPAAHLVNNHPHEADALLQESEPPE